MDIYYIYFYLRSNFTPYYVGKGKCNRAWIKGSKEIRKPKDQSRIILVEQNLTETQALILERYYIRWFGRKDNGTGILRNRTDGGDGCSGRILSPKTKEQISNSQKGKKCPYLKERNILLGIKKRGIPLKEETKQKISKSLTGRDIPKETREKMRIANIGKKLSKDHKTKISMSHKGKIKSEEHKRKISMSLKGKKYRKSRPKVLIEKTCPHCGLIGKGPNMSRYHFNKCKLYIPIIGTPEID